MRDQHVQTDESISHEDDCQSRQAGLPASSSHQDLAHRRGWRHEYQVVHGRIVDWSPDDHETENDGHLSNLPSGRHTSLSDMSDQLRHSHLPPKLSAHPQGLMTQSLPAIRPRPPGELGFIYKTSHTCNPIGCSVHALQGRVCSCKISLCELLVSNSSLSLCRLV